MLTYGGTIQVYKATYIYVYEALQHTWLKNNNNNKNAANVAITQCGV